MVHLGGPCPGLQDWIIAVLARFTNQTDNRPPNKGIIKGKIVISHTAGESGPGKSASVQIYSGNKIDPSTGTGVLSEKTSLKHGNSKKHDGMKTTSYDVKFHVGENFGTPGAFVISNQHNHKFYLQSATLQTSENQIVHFDCRSWVYPVKNTKIERLFFSNKSYLPTETPDALVELRKRELVSLRGNGTGERKEWDRIYEYDCYNDLGNPDKGQELRRPVLGGSATHPYPRRGRTGRPPSNADPSAENRRELIDLDTYVPPAERFSPKKFSEFVANSIGAGVHFLIPEAKSLFHNDSASFESFDEIHSMFTTKRSQAVEGWVSEKLKNMVPETLLRDITDASNKNPMKFPLPQIISENHLAWLNDEEFGRQMLAGTNPAAIRCLESFPPRSKNGSISSITALHVERSLDELTLDQAMSQWRIFILDHHDYLMPFLNRINTKGVCTYASRTLLFLRSDDTLKPVAIELSLPEPSNVYQLSRVFTPAREESEAALWKLAKAHVAANDSGHHQLISHWLKTHAVVEPFIIATRRHLSAMHPIHRLLDPHFKDTMHINALSRSMLINAGGILEKTLFSGEISMELSSALYKEWRFDEQSLPVDLLKRRMALKDSKDPAGVQLLFEDYPYGKDGLQIWVAIKTWVTDFCSLFYSDDNSVVSDTEIQKWWEEVRNEGHPDKRNDIGWYEIDSVSNLIEALTTLIWIASAFHASVHFGQYGYSGYPPNRPTLCRKFIPEEGTLAFGEFLKDPDKYFLKMLPERFEMTVGIAFMEVLSQHTSDEEYLGKRPTMDWTDNEEAVKRFDKFNKNLQHIEKNITERNRNSKLKNRSGPAKIPYTLLYPDTSNLSSRKGLTGMGIPNSISM